MARGKQAAAATARRLGEAEQRVAELERELAAVKAAAHQREAALKEKLATQGWEVSHRTAEQVQKLMNERMGELTDGLSAAVWRAQRLAMTEHLTWLFFKGLVTWDRFEGDREVLKFIATHGDIKAWFTLAGKYGHHHNHKDRRADARRDAVRQMLSVIADVDRSEKNADARASRKALDDVVDYARDAFTNVELSELMRDGEWVTVEPDEDQLVMHREVMETLPRFQEVAARA